MVDIHFLSGGDKLSLLLCIGLNFYKSYHLSLSLVACMGNSDVTSKATQRYVLQLTQNLPREVQLPLSLPSVTLLLLKQLAGQFLILIVHDTKVYVMLLIHSVNSE